MHTRFLLERTGAEFRHEDQARDGSISWYGEGFINGTNADDIVFDKTFHQTREPLGCISSIKTLNSGSWEYIRKKCGIDRKQPDAAMLVWLRWNEMIERRAEWRYRLEDMESAWPEMLNRLGLPSTTRPGIPWGTRGPNPHSRKHHGDYHSFTWDELKDINTSLAEQTKDMAGRYGYT